MSPESNAAKSRLVVKTRIFTAIVICTNALGNMALTYGIKNGDHQLAVSPIDYIRAIFTPWVLLGVVLLVTWMLTRMMLLSWADLSYVLPVTAIGYVLTTIIGRYFFGDAVSAARWAGTLCIVAGTSLVGATPPATTEIHPEQT